MDKFSVVLLCGLALYFGMLDHAEAGRRNRRPQRPRGLERVNQNVTEICGNGTSVGQRFFDGCNWCWCLNKTAVCTAKPCPTTRTGPRRQNNKPKRHRRWRIVISLDQCTETNPGSEYVQGKIKCRCIRVGKALCHRTGCTRRSCPMTAFSEAIIRAKEQSNIDCSIDDNDSRRFYDGCNWCSCVNGQRVCTERVCHLRTTRSPINKTRELVQQRYIPPTEACKSAEDDNKRYYDGCNWCTCMGVGRAGCTRLPCPLMHDQRPRYIPPNEACRSEDDRGRRYYDGCNWCNCMGVGEAVCTKIHCPLLDRPTGGPRYTPPTKACATEEDVGKRYFDGCNWCRCMRVGLAACTRRACRSTISQKTPRTLQ